MTVERVGVSFEPKLLSDFDKMVKKRGYSSRSEAIRDLVRKAIVEDSLKTEKGNANGTLTFVYEHDHGTLASKLLHVQHRFHHCISSSTHIHMDKHTCLEVLVVSGKAKDLRRLENSILSLKGVKHGKMFLTT
ncbi:MAG TPA: nickel-responsive transcriptional regulator NikR [Euryarchaeota archaeon]|nr:nickel-responsive transcriptional regulator NikR [Euryarchaeota archaeon]